MTLPFLSDADAINKYTQNAGTRIQQSIQGRKDRYTYVTRLSYKAGVTAHTGTLLRKVSETTLSAAAAAAQAVVVITADPGTASTGGIAGSDLVAIKKPDGTWFCTKVLSVAGLSITLNDNVPSGGLASGARFIFYGAPGDSDHNDRKFDLIASVTTTYPVVGDGVIAKSLSVDEPMWFDSDNAANAGVLENLSFGWSRGGAA